MANVPRDPRQSAALKAISNRKYRTKMANKITIKAIQIKIQ
jgi:hypothetical protein